MALCVCVCMCLLTSVCLRDLNWGNIFVPWTKLARTFFGFRVLGKSGCTAVFSVLGMHVCNVKM